jgi:hypothetical protein
MGQARLGGCERYLRGEGASLSGAIAIASATDGTMNVSLANLFLWNGREVRDACPIQRRLGVEEMASVIMLRRLREPPLEGFVCPPRRQRRSAASMQTVSSGASTLK